MGELYTLETGRTARRFTNRRRTPTGITIHHWGSFGSSFDGIVGWFCDPDTSAQTSAHYVAQGTDARGARDPRVACIVDPDLIAWHAGDWDANVATIGIECRPEARELDYAVVAELIRRLRATYGPLPLYPHKHWTSTACPGRWDIARLDALAKSTTPTGEDDDMFTDADRARLERLERELLAHDAEEDARNVLASQRYAVDTERYKHLAALAGASAGEELDPKAIADAIPPAIADDVVDALVERLSATGAAGSSAPEVSS